MSETLVEAITGCGLDLAAIDALITLAIDEDLGGREDVTSVATVPTQQHAALDLTARANGVLAGAAVAGRVFQLIGSDCQVHLRACDGDRLAAGQVVLTVTGRTQELLIGERTALNLLGHLCGVATATRAWVDVLANTPASVRDTRKTTPGMRALEKYAVRCGGGVNHRMGLWDAALVKDNHVVAAGGVAPAFAAVRRRFPGISVEVEVDSLAELAEVVDAGADLVLLDNFTLVQTAAAVALVAGRSRLESSGGLTLEDAADYASTGVDFLAVGALTHSAPVMDIGADLRILEG